MEAIHYVIAAGVAVWVGIGSYLFSLSLKQRAISARLTHIEQLGRNAHDKQV